MRQFRTSIIQEFRNYLKKPSMLILIAGLAILPSAYAWINIKAMWDPYKNTSGLRVAVVNEDEGTKIQGKPLNAGKEIVRQLRNNHQLGWVFMGKTKADRELQQGNCYASLRIPKDFSAHISTILEDHPIRPVIIFTVNEKINSITPKITGSGANLLIEQIRGTFVKQMSVALLQGFRKAGVAMKQDLPLFINAKNDLLRLEKFLPELDKIGEQARVLEGKLDQLKQKTAFVTTLVKQTEDLARSAKQITNLEEKLPLLNNAQKAEDLLYASLDTMNTIPPMIDQSQKSINDMMQSITSLEKQSNTISPNERQKLNEVRAQLQSIDNQLRALNGEAAQSTDRLSRLLGGSTRYNQQIRSNEWIQNIRTGANIMRKDVIPVIDHIQKSGAQLQSQLIKVDRVIRQTAEFSRNDLPRFEERVHIASDKIRQFDSQVDINEIIRLLTLNPESHSDFLANPVNMETIRLFPIPNYGTAMAPFYTVLSLWVGATLMISVLKIQQLFPHRPGLLFRHFTRMTRFICLGLVQTALVASGDLFLLNVYALHPWLFFWCCMLCSMVFVCITYTLCALFGTIGKGISIILLVLQLSASGGTFPITMMPPFFQRISAFLPFTYAISLIRETVGGIVPTVMFRDMGILLASFIAFLFIGWLFCTRLWVKSD